VAHALRYATAWIEVNWSNSVQCIRMTSQAYLQSAYTVRHFNCYCLPSLSLIHFLMTSTSTTTYSAKSIDDDDDDDDDIYNSYYICSCLRHECVRHPPIHCKCCFLSVERVPNGCETGCAMHAVMRLQRAVRHLFYSSVSLLSYI